MIIGVLLSFVSAFLLGCYDICKKKSLDGNAVIPVLFLHMSISAFIFVLFIMLSYATNVLDGAIFFHEKNLKNKAFDLFLVLLGMIFLYLGTR
jgi:drug/metabolite transporter (DMT)-like permease